MEEALGAEPPPERLDEAERELAQADACYDRALEVAPASREALEARAAYRVCESGALRGAMAVLRGRATEPWGEVFSSAALADYRRLAERFPDDPAAVASAAVLEFLSAASRVEAGRACPLCASVEALPAEVRRGLQQRLAALEKLRESPDRTIAAQAGAALAILRLVVFGDAAAAAADVERALALDPSREFLWLLRAAAIPEDRRADRIAEKAEAMLRHCRSATCGLIVAKAFAERGDFRRARALLDELLQHEPGHPTALLAKAVLDLREASDEQALRRARRALEAIPQRAGEPLGEPLFGDYHLAHAIALALTGESAAAEKELAAALERDPDAPALRQALGLLAGSRREPRD